MHKKCFFCGSKGLVKDGFTRGHQRLKCKVGTDLFINKCKVCGKRFVYNKRLCDSELYKEYLDGKQNVAQLAHKYGKSSKTIIRHLEKHKGIVCKRHYNRNVILLMDGTYTSNAFGVLVFKDSFSISDTILPVSSGKNHTNISNTKAGK